MLANAVLALLKTGAGILGHSYALIADGVESTLDIFSSLIVWSGLRISAAPADHDHPYGHGKAESLTTMVVAVTMLGVALALAVESVREILTPHHLPAPFTLVVLVVVVAVKEAFYRYSFRAGAAIGSMAVQCDAFHHRSDALTSLAAFVGISAALLLGKGYESADEWAALVACGVIAYTAVGLLRRALAEVLDAAPDAGLAERIRQSACAVPGVRGLDKCRVRKYGMAYYVDLHVLVDGMATVRDGHAIAHAVKNALRGANLRIADVLVHIEPVKVEVPAPPQGDTGPIEVRANP